MVRRYEQTLSNDSRASEMLEMYSQGNTLDQIGSSFGITRERVRQILSQTFGDYRAFRPDHVTKEKSLRRMTERNAEWDKANGELVKELFSQGVSDKEISAKLEVSVASVLDYRTRNGMRRTRGLDWTDDQIFAAIRLAHKSTKEPITIKTYKQWRDDLEDPGSAPSYLTLMLRFETFNDACTQASVPFGGRTNIERRIDYIDEKEVVAHARNFVEWCSTKGLIPTSGTFATYRSEVAKVPSLAIMCRRSGGFRNMIDKIIEER
jgi:DNA-binding CsgD family transcriptional regulator